MQINDTSRFPSLIDDDFSNSSSWDTSALVSSTISYSGAFSKTINKLQLSTSTNVVGNYKQTINLDSSKTYTFSIWVQSSLNLSDTNSILRVLYDNDTETGLELVSFSGFYKCNTPYVYNFSGVSTIKNLRFEFVGNATDTLSINTPRLQQGSLDLSYIVDTEDKATFVSKLNSLKSYISNVPVDDKQVHTLYDNALSFLNVLTANLNSVSSRIYPYRYAVYPTDNRTVPKNGNNNTLYINFGFGNVLDGTNYDIILGDCDLVVGNLHSQDNTYNLFKNNKTNYNDYNDLNHYLSKSNTINAIYSNTYNYFSRLNTFSWTGGGGYEWISESLTFPTNLNPVFKFTYIPPSNISYSYGGNGIPVALSYTRAADDSYYPHNSDCLNVINFDTPICDDIVDIDSMYSDLMLFFNSYNDLPKVSAMKATKNSLVTNYTNIKSAISQYSKYGITFPTLESDYNTLRNNYNSSIVKLVKGYTDSSGLHTTDTDVTTQFIPVTSGDTYIINFVKGNGNGMSRVEGYDVAKKFSTELCALDSCKFPLTVTIPNGVSFIKYNGFTSSNQLEDIIINVTDLDNYLIWSSISNSMMLGNSDNALKAISNEFETINNRLSMLSLPITMGNAGVLLQYTYNITNADGNMSVLKFTGKNYNDNLSALASVLNNLNTDVDLVVNETCTSFNISSIPSAFYQDGNNV